MRQTLRDLRYVCRSLLASPTVLVSAVACLALGIGANATMLGALDALLFRSPAHVETPERLQRFYFVHQRPGVGEVIAAVTSYPHFDALGQVEAFQDVAAYFPTSLSLGRGTRAQEARVVFVSESFFRTLGVTPLRGRVFASEESRVDNPTPVAVISWELWQSTLGGRESVLGEELWIGSERYAVIGVLPPRFRGLDPNPVDLWLPLSAIATQVAGPDWYSNPYNLFLQLFGRLTSDVAVREAEEQVTAVYRGTQRAPGGGAARVRLGPAQSARGPARSASVRVSFWVAGMSLIVLLVACVNVANLLILRSLQRRREFAVRLVLGAGRWPLVRVVLLESLLLAVLGGLGALLVMLAGGGFLRTYLLTEEMVGVGVFSLRTVSGLATITAIVALLCGITPSLWLNRDRLLSTIKAGSREGSPGQARIRMSLLMGQVALTLLLLVGSGLFVRSLQNVSQLDLGFDPDRVLAVRMNLEGVGFESVQAERLRRRALEQVSRLPGVHHAALGSGIPFRSSHAGQLFVPGREPLELATGGPYLHAVTEGYFDTLGTSVLRGRGLTAADSASGAPVIVVNETLARLYWPGEEPLGRCVHVARREAPCATVVGVVEDVRRTQLREAPTAQCYVPRSQAPEGLPSQVLFVRTEGPAAALSEPLRQELQTLDPALPYLKVQPLHEVLDPRVRSYRIGAGVFTCFGLVALALAVVGLYGAIGSSVTQRTHEMGVRLALGADRWDLLRLIVARGLWIGGVGVLLGLGIALVAGSALEPLLFELSAHDPVTLVTAAVLLIGMAAIASYLPGRRVRKIPAAQALRVE